MSPTGDRLIVVGEGGTAIIDGHGDVIAEVSGAAPIETGINELATRTAACVVVVDQVDAGLTVVSLDDGSIVAEADGPSRTVPTRRGRPRLGRRMHRGHARRPTA